MSATYKTLVKLFIALLFSIYGSLLLKAHLPITNSTSLFVGLVIFAVIFYLSRYIIEKGAIKLAGMPMAMLSLVMAGFVMIAAPKSVNPGVEPDNYALIKVTALGEKNDSAKASEVWLTNIYNGDSQFDLDAISLPRGWNEKYNSIVSYSDQPATLEIKIKDPGPLQLLFTSHPWSGKVKIEDGKKSSIVDLYNPGVTKNFKYISHSSIPWEKRYTYGEKIALAIITFLTLSIFWYIFFFFARVKNNLFLLTIPLSLFIFYMSDYWTSGYAGKLLPLALSLGTCFIMKRSHVNDYISHFTKTEKGTFFLIIIYAGFAFIGQRLFLSVFPVKHILSKGAYFILFCSWLMFMSIAFLYLTEWCKLKLIQKKQANNVQYNYSTARLYAGFMGIMVVCWLIYLIAYFPANMSADSLVQWEQANGLSKLNNWHPVFHTLFNKLMITIYNTPASIALAQILFMAGVMAAFFTFLYRKGIPYKWLIGAALIFALIPSNGILAVTLWKDIPFSISLVWLTLVFAKIVSDDFYFKRKTSYIELILALVTATLFRHNGVLVYILAIACFLIYFIKVRKRAIIICAGISFVLIGIYNLYISNPSRVVPNPPAIKLVAPIHGIAAVKYYNGHLTRNTEQMMQNILPDRIWKSHYNPYSADEYIFYTNTPFVEKLSKVPTIKVIANYANTFTHNPYLIIRDRLTGTEILWNVFEANGSFNYRYHQVIDPNRMGLSSADNGLKSAINNLLESSTKAADPFLWRAGIFNVFLLLILLLFIKNRKRHFLIFIPVIGANMSLMLSMTLQNFRYVYYVPIIFGVIWLLSLSNIMPPVSMKADLSKK